MHDYHPRHRFPKEVRSCDENMIHITKASNQQENRRIQFIEKDYYEKSFADAIIYKGFLRCTLSSLRNTILKTDKTILGYISETREGKHAYCKYNKLTGLFTVYTYINGEPKTITAYRKNWQEFTGDMGIEYFDEIPTGL